MSTQSSFTSTAAKLTAIVMQMFANHAQARGTSNCRLKLWAMLKHGMHYANGARITPSSNDVAEARPVLSPNEKDSIAAIADGRGGAKLERPIIS
jgi:hypothetical protein